MFEKLETKKELTLGFLVGQPFYHQDSAGYVPKGELELGEGRIMLGANTIAHHRMREPQCNNGCCPEKEFHYGDTFKCIVIHDSRDMMIEEVSELPEWATRTRDDAVKELKEFLAECRKTHREPTPEPPKKKSLWQRICDVFNDDDFGEF
jgi:hypothetical protein